MRSVYSVMRSLSVRTLALLVVLVVLPVLLYSIFARIEEERRALLLTAVQDAGTAITAGLTSTLLTLQPADFGSLAARLAPFADPRRQVTLLFHPAGSAANQDFFLVASVPPLSANEIAAERARLASLGVLDQLARSCAGGTPLTERVPAADGGTTVITSVTGVASTAGCWAILIAVNAADENLGLADRPAIIQRQLVLAGAVYVLMSGLILLIFSSVWTNLGRYRARALSPGSTGGFLDVTDVPEMVPVARAIDGMVQRLRDAADLLRQAAEDNAHAFKGPVAIIRQAMAPLTGATVTPETLQTSLSAVQASLDRLDGLIRSARRLDSATADLLEIAHERVDLTALLRALAADGRALHGARNITVTESLAPGVQVLGAADAIESIFENIFDNALSFSPQGGTVAVSLAVSDGVALAEIEDEGPGVPEAALQRIFERYYTDRKTGPPDAAAAAGQPAHFGIGLWIARQNARALGGDVTAANCVPHGLSVQVRLKVAPAAGSTRSAAAPRARAPLLAPTGRVAGAAE